MMNKKTVVISSHSSHDVLLCNDNNKEAIEWIKSDIKIKINNILKTIDKIRDYYGNMAIVDDKIIYIEDINNMLVFPKYEIKEVVELKK